MSRHNKSNRAHRRAPLQHANGQAHDPHPGARRPDILITRTNDMRVRVETARPLLEFEPNQAFNAGLAYIDAALEAGATCPEWFKRPPELQPGLTPWQEPVLIRGEGWNAALTDALAAALKARCGPDVTFADLKDPERFTLAGAALGGTLVMVLNGRPLLQFSPLAVDIGTDGKARWSVMYRLAHPDGHPHAPNVADAERQHQAANDAPTEDERTLVAP